MDVSFVRREGLSAAGQASERMSGVSDRYQGYGRDHADVASLHARSHRHRLLRHDADGVPRLGGSRAAERFRLRIRCGLTFVQPGPVIGASARYRRTRFVALVVLLARSASPRRDRCGRIRLARRCGIADGALGLGQLMPSTANALAVQPFEKYENLDGTARYLRRLLKRYANLPVPIRYERALAGYNAGPEAVARYGGVPPYAQTRAYVVRVMTLWRQVDAMLANLSAPIDAHPLAPSYPAAASPAPFAMKPRRV